LPVMGGFAQASGTVGGWPSRAASRCLRCRSGSRPRGVEQHLSLAAVDAAPRRTPPVASRHLAYWAIGAFDRTVPVAGPREVQQPDAGIALTDYQAVSKPVGSGRSATASRRKAAAPHQRPIKQSLKRCTLSCPTWLRPSVASGSSLPTWHDMSARVMKGQGFFA
jgi:hypothetical protein